MRIIKTVPNLSLARDKAILDKLINLCKNLPGVSLLDYSSDNDHNRTVVTLLGDYEAIKSGIITLARFALENIDLNTHTGAHPRMGSVDVIPFVPIKNVTMEDCIQLSKEVGQILGELGIPVFLYEESATAAHRKNLVTIRKGGFEGMAEKMKNEKFKPDFGDSKPHPTAGVVAVGARMPLIAFNVNLNTSDINIAGNIAKAVRGSSGGFKHCKALGIMLEEKNIAQVSMNIVNYKNIPLYRVMEVIRMEAARYGVNILGTEIIGLTPSQALVESAAYYLQLENFDENQVVETHV